jgi:hypothetical protein
VLRISGVPARHGPATVEHLMGEVIGFVLSGESLPTVYVSGDNALPDAVALFAGDAERPHVGEELADDEDGGGEAEGGVSVPCSAVGVAAELAVVRPPRVGGLDNPSHAEP